MDWVPSALRWLFDSRRGAPDRLISRWLFLRALGCIYFSAFFSLVFQIRGLIGPDGVLPANQYLQAVAHSFGYGRGLWFAPTLLWLASGPHMLIALCWVGMLASLLLAINAWPRGMLLICFVCFLSFVSAAQDFSSYQSDGMLLEAGFIALFFAPSGLRPGFGSASRASRASLFLLQWEWFRIYFESGVAKIVGGDPEWRNFTAMDEYYQNGPLPTWIGWYMQHLPHWFHASTVFVRPRAGPAVPHGDHGLHRPRRRHAAGRGDDAAWIKVATPAEIKSLSFAFDHAQVLGDYLDRRETGR